MPVLSVDRHMQQQFPYHCNITSPWSQGVVGCISRLAQATGCSRLERHVGAKLAQWAVGEQNGLRCAYKSPFEIFNHKMASISSVGVRSSEAHRAPAMPTSLSRLQPARAPAVTRCTAMPAAHARDAQEFGLAQQQWRDQEAPLALGRRAVMGLGTSALLLVLSPPLRSRAALAPSSDWVPANIQPGLAPNQALYNPADPQVRCQPASQPCQHARPLAQLLQSQHLSVTETPFCSCLVSVD